MKQIWVVLVLAGLLTPFRTASFASAGGGGGGSFYSDSSDHSAFEKSQRVQGLYQKGIEATNNGDFDKAIDYFRQVLQLKADDADALNMLAHAQRKTGKIDEALDNYKKALQIQPNFPQAREYLGEAYIQAALREMDTLKGEGQDGQDQLQLLQMAFKDAASNLDKPAN